MTCDQTDTNRDQIDMNCDQTDTNHDQIDTTHVPIRRSACGRPWASQSVLGACGRIKGCGLPQSSTLHTLHFHTSTHPHAVWGQPRLA
eukprot:366279-Chlamydomonas_euryale.AAC.18